jgi:putative ABC transport system permease protein
MTFRDLLAFALSSVLAHRMRSGLTILGILVGIASVVLLTSVGEGVRQYVLGEFTQFGTNVLRVSPGKIATGGGAATINTTRPLSLADAEALAKLQPVQAVVPFLAGNASVEYGIRQRRTNIFGVGAGMPLVWKLDPAIGRFLPDDGFRNPRAHVVLGHKMRTELFADANPVGARVRIAGEPYRVIGAMQSKGQMLGFDMDDIVFIPVVKAMDMFDKEGLDEIDVAFRPGVTSEHVSAAVKRVLTARHGREDFTVTTQDQMLEVLNNITSVLTNGVGALGGISLLVGAVGILTIMTIAVTERTAEIGLLRAIGARRQHILSVFLGEAVLLGGLGGMLGIVAAIVVVQGLKLLVPELPLATAWWFVALAFFLSVLIGLLAGIVPAMRAAAMRPLDALRAE